MEEPQAKEDPVNDEIEGLDTEVLLNADILEEGKLATLDFKGQEELLPMPPHHATHAPLPPYSNHHQFWCNCQQVLLTQSNN